MSSHIITLSPKGQFTLPAEERKTLKYNRFLLKREGKGFLLQPVEFQLVEEGSPDGIDDFEMLATENFKELWNNADDDIYQKFYSDVKNRL